MQSTRYDIVSSGSKHEQPGEAPHEMFEQFSVFPWREGYKKLLRKSRPALAEMQLLNSL
jgi:hypothetical protein